MLCTEVLFIYRNVWIIPSIIKLLIFLFIFNYFQILKWKKLDEQYIYCAIWTIPQQGQYLMITFSFVIGITLYLLCLSQARTCISYIICHGLFCVQWVQLRWEVIVNFVDIGGINDHHCLNFLFIIKSYNQYFFWRIMI